MMKIEFDWIKKALYLIVLLIIGIIGGISSQYIRAYTSEAQEYFHYTSLSSTKENYEIWEDIYFESIIDRLENTNMKYIDTLRCDTWEDFTWFSQNVSFSKDLEPWLYTSVWRYNWDIPQVYATCYLDSTPTVILNFWLEKTQKIKTNTFTIWGSK